jgi:3-isopropylmalate/(R)-2-methylmalate dehydratase small subunit
MTEPFRRFSSRLVPLPNENVDTDQIIPARFLKTTTKEGLGKALFHDWRYDAGGNPKPDFILNKPEIAGARILLAGNNFGCGSSREHAPWALSDFGFRAVISTSFADIFRGNSLKNALLPILVGKAKHEELFRLCAEHPEAEVTVDLQAQALTLPGGGRIGFQIEPFSRKCLLEGIDELGFLLRISEQISAYESARSY